MPSLAKSSTKYAILFLAVFCFLLNNANGMSQPNLRQGSVAEKKTEKSTAMGTIPKVAHFMILGNVPTVHSLEMVRINREYIEADGWQTMLWHNDDVELLMEQHGDAKLSQAWKWVKDDLRGESRLEKMENFIKPLIMYVHGGVFLDADMVPCESLDYMVDESRVVSFPMLYGGSGQVNTRIMSAPPGHPLMQLALEEFIAIGHDITWINNDVATGPVRMAQVIDIYMEVLGVHLHLSFADVETNIYDEELSVTTHGSPWTKIVDVRFMEPQSNLMPSTYHLSYESQIPVSIDYDTSCYARPEYIAGFMKEMCLPKHRSHETRFYHCGENQIILSPVVQKID